MNGHQRIAAVMQGQWPDRVPVMLHNFMLAAREAGHTMRRFARSPNTSPKPSSAPSRRITTTGSWSTWIPPPWPRPWAFPVDLPDDDPARCHGRLPAESLHQIQELEPPRCGRPPAHPGLARGDAASWCGTSAAKFTSGKLRSGTLLLGQHDAYPRRLDDGPDGPKIASAHVLGCWSTAPKRVVNSCG
jgi:hypothetical protein